MRKPRRDEPDTANVWVLPLRRRVFPGGKKLLVAVDAEGLRQEYVIAAREPWALRLVPLKPTELIVTVGPAKLQRILHVDTAATDESDPVVLAFVDWLAELIELGLEFGDPHPELVAWWCACDRTAMRPLPWGEAAVEVLRRYGVWTPPQRCPDCGALPDGRPSGDCACADCRPLTRGDAILTDVGGWRLPLARWLDRVEHIYDTAFQRRPKAGIFVRELGVRGILSIGGAG